MKLLFTKMHGLGNDFVVVDATDQPLDLTPDQVRHIARRRYGVGCDQLLVLEASSAEIADFRYRVYNADGAEVDQCGNGARCIARFVHARGLSGKRALTVEATSGTLRLERHADGTVTVNMGVPRLAPHEVPFETDAGQPSYRVEVDGETLALSAVSMGNPHAVVQVDDIQQAPVARLGPRIESHPRFPLRTNAGFMEIAARDHIRLRVYERGVGETLACGSAACAATVAGRLLGLLDEEVTVELPGGRLMISWGAPDRPVLMTGPATHVFEGSIEI